MSKSPLWEVIDRAWWSLVDTAEPHCDPPAGDQAACVIRALRDWLVPEEPPPHRGMRPGGTNLTYQETLSVERQRLRALLTAEADRAEQGSPPVADPSPARAIVRVFDDRYELAGLLESDWQEQCLAAALVALADQVAPEPPMVVPGGRSYESAWSATVQDAIRRQILAIAAELRGTNG